MGRGAQNAAAGRSRPASAWLTRALWPLQALDQSPTMDEVRKFVVALAMAVTLAACSSGRPLSQRSTTSSTGVTTTTVPRPPCTTGQIAGEIRGIQGEAGTWTAEIWVADMSPTPCALQSPVEMDLLNSSGVVQLHASAPYSVALPLTANTPFPALGSIPSAGQLANFALFWPNDANAAAAMGTWARRASAGASRNTHSSGSTAASSAQRTNRL